METDEVIDISDSDIEFVQEYTDLEPENTSNIGTKPMLKKAQSMNSVSGMDVDAEDVLIEEVLAEERKNEGNDLYKVGEYVGALRCYSDAVSTLKTLSFVPQL